MVVFALPFLLVVWHWMFHKDQVNVIDDVGAYLCQTAADTHLSNTEQASILLHCRPWRNTWVEEQQRFRWWIALVRFGSFKMLHTQTRRLSFSMFLRLWHTEIPLEIQHFTMSQYNILTVFLNLAFFYWYFEILQYRNCNISYIIKSNHFSYN